MAGESFQASEIQDWYKIYTDTISRASNFITKPTAPSQGTTGLASHINNLAAVISAFQGDSVLGKDTTVIYNTIDTVSIGQMIQRSSVDQIAAGGNVLSVIQCRNQITYSNSSNSNGSNSNGSKSNGSKSNGSCSNGYNSKTCSNVANGNGGFNHENGSHSNGGKVNGIKTNGYTTHNNVYHSNGTNSHACTNGTNSNGTNSNETCTNGANSNGTCTNKSCTDIRNAKISAT